jgi:signal transduction histidine kinase
MDAATASVAMRAGDESVASEEALRDSGIEVIGAVPWGTHFCQFYESADDLAAILIPYFTAGLQANEYCMWVTSEPLKSDEAERRLRQAVPDLDAYQRRGAIEILPYTDWYIVDGAFDSQRVLDGWVAKEQAARERGFDGLRLTGNTFWLETSGWKDFYAYEQAVNDVIGRYRMIALCTYSLQRCGAAEVLDVVHTHQFALAKRGGEWAQIEDTERKRAIAEVERLNLDLERQSRQLQAANEELEAFTYSVSHDLHAPLRAIDGFSKLLLESAEGALDEQSRHQLERIRAAGVQMGALIDDLLKLSRLSRQAINPRPIDLSALASEIAAELHAWETDGRLTVSIQPGIVVVGEPELVRAALTNLLSNAFKFTADEPQPRIELGTERRDSEQVLFISDNGVGFDMRYSEKLFRPFERLHDPKRFPGTGVGLATVQRIVNRHGGRIWAEGQPGEGATFYFTLPR